MSRRRKKLAGRTLDRRTLLRYTGLSLLGASGSGWFPAWAGAAHRQSERRQCVLLWMNGGPSQIDTFDMKPDHANGGQFNEIETSVAGLRISEHLPQLARRAEHLAIVRSLSTKEGDHRRGTFLMRTGQPPGGPITYPAIGSSLSKELGDADSDLPAYVTIAPFDQFGRDAYGPGFLGPAHAPLVVAARAQNGEDEQPADGSPYARLGVDALELPAGISLETVSRRRDLWRGLQDEFLAGRQVPAALAHDTAYRRAERMLRSPARAAFELSEEPDAVRERYGAGRFGQGCLLARRLIEIGVPCVEVTLGDFEGGDTHWDTHANNFDVVRRLCGELDAGWSALLDDLADRGLLQTTTFLWMGEFGRTPRINGNAGRDHFPAAWTCVFAGGGIRGGQAYGSTSDDGMEVASDRVEVGDVLATLCRATGIDPGTENHAQLGRPIRIAEGNPIDALLA